jgi:hypothetical protein
MASIMCGPMTLSGVSRGASSHPIIIHKIPTLSSAPSPLVERNIVDHNKINYICSCLSLCKIRTTADFRKHFHKFLEMVCQNPTIFNLQSSRE